MGQNHDLVPGSLRSPPNGPRIHDQQRLAFSVAAYVHGARPRIHDPQRLAFTTAVYVHGARPQVVQRHYVSVPERARVAQRHYDL